MFGYNSWRAESSYSNVGGEDKLLSEDREQPFETSKRSPTWPFVLPWIISSVVFAYLSLHFYLKSLEPTYGSFETGWSTEFGINPPNLPTC